MKKKGVFASALVKKKIGLSMLKEMKLKRH